MRLTACELGDMPIAAVPLVVGVEPVDGFRDWLLDRIGHDEQFAGNGLSRAVEADPDRTDGSATNDEPR